VSAGPPSVRRIRLAEGVSFDEVQDRIRRIKWYHSIRIGNVITSGIEGEDHLAWMA